MTLSSVEESDADPKRWSQSADFMALVTRAMQNFELGHRLCTTEVLQFSNEVSLVKSKLASKQQELVASQYDKDQLQLSLQSKNEQIRTLKAETPQTVPQVLRALAFIVACSGAPKTALLIALMSFFKEQVYMLIKLLMKSSWLRMSK